MVVIIHTTFLPVCLLEFARLPILCPFPSLFTPTVSHPQPVALYRIINSLVKIRPAASPRFVIYERKL